ncbi:MAG: hypothetical protein PVG78_03305 [Desulfobacterales bacterium]|jgi:hypothetical protein
MPPKLDLRLPARDRKPSAKPAKALFFLNLLVLLAVLVDIGFSVWMPASRLPAKTRSSLPAEAQQKLALKLEQQGLDQSAIAAWKQYLLAASLGEEQIAKIWYRIGKLYQHDRQYERAIESFYRCESFAAVSELAPEISRRVQECLETMGKFAALRGELSDRVTLPKPGQTAPASKGDKIVAEIGPEKITQSDLDQWIELQIGRQLAQVAPYLPAEQVKKQKEALFHQFSSSVQRQMFLNQMVGEEILCRKAGETGLLKDPQVQAEIKRQERALLARDLLQKEYADNINITESDLKTYYEAHRKDYKTGEKGSRRQQPFEDVRNEIYQTLWSQKKQEVQQHLLDELKETYDVVIHRSAFEDDRAQDAAGSVKDVQGKVAAAVGSGRSAPGKGTEDARSAPGGRAHLR